jgi:3-hydroxybutyryl-CoA dehydrogenase
MEDFADLPFVIEAVTENPELKFALFKKLDQSCRPDAILATNTSSISITTIAAQTKRPEKVGGIHFMNPVPVMKLVEGIRGLQTSDETFRAIRDFAETLGKTFVEATDQPGFAVNRILMPMINEAVTALHEGVASATDIDTAMKLGTNQPMGPLELADFIGLDTCLAIMNVLHEGLGDSKYRPSPLLKKYVAAGWLGRKSGRGFHRYDRA